MVRRKRYSRARRASSPFRKRSRSRRSSGFGFGMSGTIGTLVASAAYGAVREKVSTVISPLTSKIPLGDVADEVGMIIVATVAKKYIKNPIVTKIADAALIVEGARIGESIATGRIMGGNSSIGGQLPMYS